MKQRIEISLEPGSEIQTSSCSFIFKEPRGLKLNNFTVSLSLSSFFARRNYLDLSFLQTKYNYYLVTYDYNNIRET